MKTFRTLTCIGVILLICFPLHSALAQHDIALRGTVVTPDQVIENGTVIISGDKIESVGTQVSLPTNVTVIDGDYVIYPGLIDLHNHLTWDFLPRWSPNQLFSTRYEWKATPAYGIALGTPHAKIFAEGLACQTNQYAEVKALIGGATSVVGSLSPFEVPASQAKCIDGLARNLDFYSGLYPPGTPEKLRYEVFPLELDNNSVTRIANDLDNKALTSFIVHVAEGKPGDANAEEEFWMLRARGFLRPGVSIIHGVGLNTADLQTLAKDGVGLIWSPHSNLNLYGGTTDVFTAKQAGVKIALAPDWSPTGSDGMLQELKYAAIWNQGRYPVVFTNSDLVQMATSVPAQLVGLSDKIGSIKPGLYADLLVVRRTEKDPYQSLLNASPADVQLVLIGGSPVYGDQQVMRKLAPAADLEPLLVCGAPKALDFSTETAAQGTRPQLWKQTVDQLNHALNEWDLSPVQLTACPN